MTVTYISNERKVYGCVSRDSTRTDSSTAHRTEPADVHRCMAPASKIATQPRPSFGFLFKPCSTW